MFNLKPRLLFEEKKEGEGGGGSNEKKESSSELAQLLEQNKKLMERLDAIEAKNKPDDSDFKNKVDNFRKEESKKHSDSKTLEAALSFNLKSQDFLKNHAALLPKNVGDIFKVADSEKYDSAVEKASDIKSGLIHSFFSIQDNINLLTASQKEAVEDYLKLTKNGRQENAQQIFQNIFEPTLEMLKRIKKTEEVHRARNGFGDGSDDSYKQKLIGLSKKHYLGEKQNGT